MVTVVFLAAALIVAFLLRRSPAVALTLAATLAVLVPTNLRSMVADGPHPAAQFLIIYAVIYGMARKLAADAPRYKLVPWPLLVFVLIIYPFFDVLQGTAPFSIVLTVVNLVIAPVCALYVGRSARSEDAEFGRKVGLAILAIAVAVAVLGMLQSFTNGEFVPFVEQRRRVYWWYASAERAESWRSLGTFGNALDFAMFLVLAVPLVRFVRSPLIRIMCAAALIGGVAASQSRSQLVVVFVAAAAVLLFDRRRPVWTWVAFVVAAAAGVNFAISSGLLAGVNARVENDYGSSQLRANALSWAINHASTFLIGGYPGDRDLRSTGVLGSSLENSYLVIGLSFGLVFAACYLVYQIVAALSAQRGPEKVTACLIALLSIIASASYSGFATNRSS